MKKATKQSRLTKARKHRQAVAYRRFRLWFVAGHRLMPPPWVELSERSKQLIVEKFG
jgi:hypothetical protein